MKIYPLFRLSTYFPNLKKYLEGGTKESLMRLMSLMIVITGCFSMLTLVIAATYSLICYHQIGLDISAMMIANTGWIAVGITGKYKQSTHQMPTRLVGLNKTNTNDEFEKTE